MLYNLDKISKLAPLHNPIQVKGSLQIKILNRLTVKATKLHFRSDLSSLLDGPDFSTHNCIIRTSVLKGAMEV